MNTLHQASGCKTRALYHFETIRRAAATKTFSYAKKTLLSKQMQSLNSYKMSQNGEPPRESDAIPERESLFHFLRLRIQETLPIASTCPRQSISVCRGSGFFRRIRKA